MLREWYDGELTGGRVLNWVSTNILFFKLNLTNKRFYIFFMLPLNRCVLTSSRPFAWKPPESARNGNMPYQAKKMPIPSPMMKTPPLTPTALSCSPWSWPWAAPTWAGSTWPSSWLCSRTSSLCSTPPPHASRDRWLAHLLPGGLFCYFLFLINLFISFGGWLLYSIVMIFSIHQHESATGIPVWNIVKNYSNKENQCFFWGGWFVCLL